MGNCFSSLTNFTKLKTLFDGKSKKEDSIYLIDDDQAPSAAKPRKRYFLHRISDRYRKRQAMKSSITSILSNQLPSYYNRLFEFDASSSSQNQNDNNIPLQCLDAKALLLKQTNLTPDNNSSSSSLDLEWEHEYDPDDSSTMATNVKPNGQWLLPNNNNNISSSSSSSAAASPHPSSITSNSLEWWGDSVGGPEPFDYADIDTENLLNEIDRLTKKALNETGIELL